MASAREHFALDWIKTDLLETLRQAREALDDFAEQGADETRLRVCLTSLHQVHGTLVMLELEGVTLLADHLEQVAQALMSSTITNVPEAGQSLMQGILELPGYLDELQRGAEDTTSPFVPLVNELRAHLSIDPLPDSAGESLLAGATDDVVERYHAIGGAEKVAKIRSAYQHVLLSILKGEDRSRAVETLKKIATGLERVSQGSALARQWQAFAEFVVSLSKHQGALESEAVKLLRRVDLEIKQLAQDGATALRRPANMELVQQLLDGAVARDHDSETVTGLQQAVDRDVKHNTLAISGREALSSAAGALQDELAVIKDKLDLLVRGQSVNLEELRQLITPLKQIGSTLSLLGFESSRAIVFDQIESIENLVVLGDGDPQNVQGIAAALVQIDENLGSVAQGSEQSEVEQITSQAQIQLLREARKGLDLLKQGVVDYVTTHWDVRHLNPIPDTLTEVSGALAMVPLSRAMFVLDQIKAYVLDKLQQGHQPDLQELELFADVVSAVDYYLERLCDESAAGTEDILATAERSLATLIGEPVDQAGQPMTETDNLVAQPDVVPVPQSDQQIADDLVAELDDATTDTAIDVAADTPTTPVEQPSEDVSDDADVLIDTADLEQQQEPKLASEDDPTFDLSAGVFDDLPGAVQPSANAEQPAPNAEEALDAQAEPPALDAPVQPDEAPLELEQEDVSVEPVAAQAHQSAEDLASPVDQAAAPPPADPEIVEIFVEEVDEVLETVDEWLPQWAAKLDNADALAEIRRAFHTLKGSGRIVQAVVIGEMAWGIENMLNRVIDETVTVNDQFVAIVQQARAMVPELRDQFAQGAEQDLAPVSALIDRADVLASGGVLEAAQISEDAAPQTEPDTQAAPDDTDELSRDGLVDEAWLDESLAAFDDDVDQPAAAEEESIGDNHYAMFVAETQKHLELLNTANQVLPWRISEELMRALHTLAGSAAIAQMQQVQLIVDPAYQVAETFRHQPPSPQLQAFFVDTHRHLSECFAALEQGGHWEEPLEFVAAADDLLARSAHIEDPAQKLLDAPSTHELFQSEAGLREYLLGQRETATDALNALSELVSNARTLECDEIADVADALLQVLTVAAIETQPPLAQSETISAGLDALLAQLNALAAGAEVSAHESLIEALQSIRFDADDAALLESVDVEDEELESAEVSADDLATASNELDEPIADEAAQELTEPAITPDEHEQDTAGKQTSDSTSEVVFDDIDFELVEVFFDEAEELSEDLESNVVAWSGEHDNRLYLENLLRVLHTMKGGARLCGLLPLGEMAHDFESLVIEVQNNERAVDDALFAELNRRYDQLTAYVADVKQQVSGQSAGDFETPAPTTAATASVEHSEKPVSEVNNIVEAFVGQHRDAQDVEPAPAASTAPETAPAVERASQEMVRVGSALLEELVNLAGESSILRARIEQGMSDFTSALDEMETTIERVREQLRRLEIETETQILFRHERQDGPQYENFDPLEMDRYSHLQQLSRGLSESASDMLDLKDTLLFKARESETLLLQQARINTELQEGLMRTRMVPFSRLLPRLRQIVRQVSTELEKEVEFHVQNAEGELDRNLLERMVPPLEHMLRNAVDHGIESADLRRSYGKPEAGRIDLRLSREGGDVVIEISDDGAGIDVESVRAKATERGLMSPQAQLSDDEVMQFVLAPGFSTAKSVTQISGRGVGMDVVHSEVKQLGGSINILSHPGKGTRFIVRVPFTVSVNRALMVSIGDDQYAVPLNTIEGIVLLSPEQLDELYASDSKTFEYAGIPYRVRYLGQYLGREYRPGASGHSSIPVVLVRSGDHAVALHVDLVQGSREIVVKSLGPQFAGVGGISGATILGDGSVVVILDLLALIRAQRQHSSRKNTPALASIGRPRCVMVVDDSVTVRKVTSRLLERQGMDVMVAKDGVEAVALLQERRPDVMLLDIEMPRMDGFEVARQVRHDDRLDSLPIVMISSRTGDKHKEHASELGVNKFLGKPFQENELLATIDELVNTSGTTPVDR